MEPNNRIKVLFIDSAVAYGGTINLLQSIFENVDRNQLEPKLISALPQIELHSYFKGDEVAMTYKPRMSYVAKEQLKERISGFPYLFQKVVIYLFALASLLANLANYCRMLATIIREKPDVIHINNCYMPLAAAYFSSTPIVWHFHGVPEKVAHIYKLLQKRVNHYIAISEYIRAKAISAGFDHEKIHTILNPAPPRRRIHTSKSDFLNKYSLSADEMLISHIGRLVPWKGQLQFLHAFSLTAKQTPNIHALVIGEDAENFCSGYKQKLHDFVVNHGIEDKVSFLGHINAPLEILAHSDIVVHSSLDPEPFGLVITEAMSTGTAVVCSNRGATNEIIQNGHSGFLCDPENLTELANTLLALVNDDKLRNKIAENGKKRVISCFSLENYFHRLLNTYKSLVS